MDALVADVAERRGSSGDEREAFRSSLPGLSDLAKGPAWADGRDVVGEAYQRVVSASSRRSAGQFFTPLWVGRAMAHWLLSEPTKIVLDPGCGSGSLLIAGALERVDSGVRLLGLDSDELAIEMAKATRGIRGIHGMELRSANFLTDPVGEEPDAVICNPPFTRHHDVAVELKAAIHEGFEDRLGLRLSRLASLHVLFLVRALEVSSEDARLAFITPSHWLEMGYGQAVKRFLLEQARVEAIVNFPAEHLIFPGVQTTATITLIRKGVSSAPTRILECDGVSAAANFIVSGIKGKADEHDALLDSGSSWSNRRKKNSSRVRLRTLAVVHRGVATGYNSYFVLSEARRKELDLSRSSLRHCLASPRHFGGQTIQRGDFDDFDDEIPRWLLSPKQFRASGPLRRYLDLGAGELRVTERSLVESRVRAGRRWFEVMVPEQAPILFTYFNRPAARFVRNEAEAVPLNSWLVVRPRDGVDVEALFQLLCSPKVIERLPEDARVYGEGLWKLEPSQLLDAWLPNEALELVGSAR